jgi:hypothetical protein
MFFIIYGHLGCKFSTSSTELKAIFQSKKPGHCPRISVAKNIDPAIIFIFSSFSELF